VSHVQARLTLPPPSERVAIRRAAGISVERLAQALRVSPRAVTNWERGTRMPREQHLAAYGVVLRELQTAVEAANRGSP
jgi:DNA-binding transcriptional regulator YiaG